MLSALASWASGPGVHALCVPKLSAVSQLFCAAQILGFPIGVPWMGSEEQTAFL